MGWKRVVLPWTLVLACAPDGAIDDDCGPGAYPDDRDGTCFCEPGFHGDPAIECFAHADLCGEAADRVGHSVCAHTIDDDAQWRQLSAGGGPIGGGARRLGKYMVPANGAARLPTVFNDANYYRLHYCLMAAGFEPLFPEITTAQHAALIFSRAAREYYAGSTFELGEARPTGFGFSVETVNRPEENLDVDTIYAVYRTLSDRFAPGELAYIPRGELQEAAAAEWDDPPFPLASATDDEVPYETYTPGIAYGRIRIDRGEQPAVYGWQDIVVFDDVPLLIEGVMAAAITGGRQDILSHLNVLSGQRGTPNIFVDDAIAVFEAMEGQLVRLEANAGTYTLQAASDADAQAYWDEHRPVAAVENPAQLDYQALGGFSEIPTATPQERADARARFGSKTVGLATLSHLIDARYQTPGFGVPFHYYDEFMSSNTWTIDLGDGETIASYAETIAAWLEDPEFHTDPAVRRSRLEQLRTEMTDHGVVSDELVAALRDRIVEEFGADTVMVRVRSSSNAEDSPTFNGAGLYESASACAADSFASAEASESACDDDKDPRPLEQALALVWSSLWSFGAFEEREYYQMDHRTVAMGATISLRYEDELANGVAFTGNPRDARNTSYLVNAQVGETDVVSPTPGVIAELSYLTIEDEQVTHIDRVFASSLANVGEVVLSDAQLQELGALMAQLSASYPIDYTVEGGPTPLLDIEFKIAAETGGLVLKQIRTFTPTPRVSDPTCQEPS
jgi:pyruvate, water dikinase